MSDPGVVVGVCIAIAVVAILLGVLIEWMSERAEAKRARKRPGYIEIPPGERRLP